MTDAIAAAHQDLGEADEVLSRIDLLFGVASDTRMRAVETAEALGQFFEYFEEWPPSDGYQDELAQADRGYLLFNLEARKAIERYGAALPRIWRR